MMDNIGSQQDNDPESNELLEQNQISSERLTHPDYSQSGVWYNA